MKSGIDRFLQVVNQIEDDSKAVLEILTSALDAGSVIGMARQIEADHRPRPGSE